MQMPFLRSKQIAPVRPMAFAPQMKVPRYVMPLTIVRIAMVMLWMVRWSETTCTRVHERIHRLTGKMPMSTGLPDEKP